MRFFSYESKFSQLLMKLCYACYLELLWVICSLPIFTIGASTTALYYCCLKIVREEDSHVGAMFFRAFRENFKQATVLWLILLGLGIFLATDGYILIHLRRTTEGPMAVIWTLILALVIGAAVLYTIELTNIFPLVASVRNTNIAMLKNAFLIGTHYLFATILVVLIHFAMFYLVVAVFTPLLVFGEGLCALVRAWLLDRLLISVSGEREEETAEDEESAAPEAPELPEDVQEGDAP